MLKSLVICAVLVVLLANACVGVTNLSDSSDKAYNRVYCVRDQWKGVHRFTLGIASQTGSAAGNDHNQYLIGWGMKAAPGLQVAADYASGESSLGKLEGRLVILLDLDKVLTVKELKSLKTVEKRAAAKAA